MSSPRMVAAVLVLAGFAAVWPALAQTPDSQATSGTASSPESALSQVPPVYVGKAFLFEADIERGIALGWCPADASREELLDAVARTLDDRVRRSGKFVEAAVRREGGDRFSVTFVGQQAPGFEDLVVRGLGMAGRLAYRVVASEEEIEACGAAAAPDAAGCADLVPLEWWRSVDSANRPADRPPLIVHAEPQHLLHADTVEKFRVVGLADGSVGLEVTLGDEGWSDLEEFLARVGSRELAFTSDGAVVRRGIEPGSLERTVLIQGGFSLNDLRPLTLAFAGEPLPVPLRFVGTAERELPNVKWRDSPTAIE